MHTVLWDNAKWQRCEMSTMVTPTEVKKAYRRACLAVHPDKVCDKMYAKTRWFMLMQSIFSIMEQRMKRLPSLYLWN